MPRKINDFIVVENMIYLHTIEDKKRETVNIDLKQIGVYGENEKIVVTQILKYAIKNNYEFSNTNSKTKPYFLTMKAIVPELEKNPYIILEDNLLYKEYKNSVAELYQQFYNIKEYLYKNTQMIINEDGKVDKMGGIYVPIQFREVKEKFKEPVKINIDEFGKAIRENNERICNCRYIISKEGKRYIVLANEKELEANQEIQTIKKEYTLEYLKLIAERNQNFLKYTGISEIYLIDNNFCIEDKYSECLYYNIRKDLIEYLQQTEVIEKSQGLQNSENVEL